MALEVDMSPLQLHDLIAARAGQQQQFDGCSWI
jgi:hypothetical protein